MRVGGGGVRVGGGGWGVPLLYRQHDIIAVMFDL